MNQNRQLLYANPLFRALSPDREFIHVKWLSPELNPFAERGVKMAALVLSSFPHIKMIPVIEMVASDWLAGRLDKKHTLVVDSSGNTAHAAALFAASLGIQNVKVVLSADVPAGKRAMLAALEPLVTIIEVPRGESVPDRAAVEGNVGGHYRLNQYSHGGNPISHQRYTAPEIRRAIRSAPAVVAVALGSGGTAAGLGRYFSKEFEETQVIGVRPVLGDKVSGARDESRLSERTADGKHLITIHWQQAVSAVEEVTAKDAEAAMRQLWTEVEPPPGLTSGLAYCGLISYLNRLDSYRLGKMHSRAVAFLCADDCRAYV